MTQTSLIEGPQLVPLNLPPGVWRNGTAYQAKGRWRDAQLVRFYEQVIRPIGGWTAHSATAVSGAARAIQTWIDHTGLAWIMVGTHNKLYVYNAAGNQSDITPSGLTAGRPDATLAAGYGGSTWGAGTYGTSRGGSTALLDATMWTLDTLEDTPVGCNADDGKLYSWDLVTAHAASQPAGSPSNNRAVFVTDEGFTFVLGAGGDPRKVQWPDQSSLTAWTPTTTNQAGSYAIQTPGRLMCGTRFQGNGILFASTDVHEAKYIGGVSVYSFGQIGAGCGIISQGAYAKGQDLLAWMSLTGFWKYDGQVSALPCEVQDDVFKSLNLQQRSKIFAVHNAAFGEIAWYYPRGTEIDSYVIWNYRENHWTNGALARTCGAEAGVFAWPLMVDAAGALWRHESGFAYAGATAPYLESGPIELDLPNGPGFEVFECVGVKPDALTLGDVQLTFYGRFEPLGTEYAYGPYALAGAGNVRFQARQARLRASALTAGDWRLGTLRLETRPAGQR